MFALIIATFLLPFGCQWNGDDGVNSFKEFSLGSFFANHFSQEEACIRSVSIFQGIDGLAGRRMALVIKTRRRIVRWEYVPRKSLPSRSRMDFPRYPYEAKSRGRMCRAFLPAHEGAYHTSNSGGEITGLVISLIG